MLGATDIREEVDPFLTNEAFHLFFELTHELESELQLFFGLILRALVVSHEINLELPLTYAGIFLIVMAMLYCVRNPFTRCISTIKKRPIE